jgi:hypothetical protein
MSLPICPTDCTSNLPAFNFDECNPELNNAEIAWVYFTTDTDGNGLANAADALEWDSRLSQSASGANQIRAIRVIGEFPAVADNEKEVSGGRIQDGVKDFIIQGDIDETNQTNHDALRELECNTGNQRVWFETRDGQLYGGNDGIRKAKLKLKLVISRSYNDLILYNWTVKWKNKFTPERQASVITDAMRNQ